MLSFYRTTLFIGIVVSLLMCSKQKDVVEIYEENALVEKYEIDEDSVRHGVTMKYYLSGKVFEHSTYQSGKLIGERKLFFENGIPEIIERYCDGIICDTFRTFYDTGVLKFEGEFINGEMTGKAKSYYPSGALKEEVNFEVNIEDGPFIEYYPNGKIKWKGNYLNGPNEFGLLSEYDTTGTLIRKMMCDSMAICQTIWTPESGEIATKAIFK